MSTATGAALPLPVLVTPPQLMAMAAGAGAGEGAGVGDGDGDGDGAGVGDGDGEGVAVVAATLLPPPPQADSVSANRIARIAGVGVCTAGPCTGRVFDGGAVMANYFESTGTGSAAAIDSGRSAGRCAVPLKWRLRTAAWISRSEATRPPRRAIARAPRAGVRPRPA